MNEEKYLIGIDYANRDSVIGSFIITQVIIKSNFFRNFSFLKLQEPMTQFELNRTVELSQKHLVDFRAHVIKATELEDINTQHIKGIIELLNTQQYFWKHKIHIHWPEQGRDEFDAMLISLLPNNLKSKSEKFRLDKWIVHDGIEHLKPIMLAQAYAKYWSTNELNEIRAVWGEYGMGNANDGITKKFLEDHPDCPHIRRCKTDGTNHLRETDSNVMDRVI